MTESILIHYSFDNTVPTDTVVNNEGSLDVNGVFTMNSKVICTDFAVGSKCLVVGSADSVWQSINSFTLSGTLDFSETSFTVCFWLKSSNPGYIYNYPVFNFSDGSHCFMLIGYTDPGTYSNTLSLFKYDNNETLFYVVTDMQLCCDLSWHHYAVVYDKQQSLFFIYMDGSLKGSVSTTSGYNISNNNCNDLGLSTNALNVLTTSVEYRPYSMSMFMCGFFYYYDDFRVYARALETSELQTLTSLYSNTLNVFQPWCHYTFEKIVPYDYIANEGKMSAQASLFYNSTETIVSCTDAIYETQCLRLDAAKSSFVRIPYLPLTGLNWCVCFWYRKEAVTVNESDVRVFDFSTEQNCVENEISVGFSECTGGMFLTVGGTLIQFCMTNCCDGAWRHVAIVYDSFASKYSFYFNGIMCYASTNGPSIGSYTTRSCCYIGKTIISTNVYQYATLLVDDFRIYDEVLLTQTDIARICGNNGYYVASSSNSTVSLLNSLLNCYLPSTPKAQSTELFTTLGNLTVDLNTLYAPYSNGSFTYTSYNVLFVPWKLSNCMTCFSADQGVCVNDDNDGVMSWSDCNEGNITATSAVAPMYVTDCINMNGQPCIIFDSTIGQCLKFPLTTQTVTSMTICLVLYVNSSSEPYRQLICSEGVWTTNSISHCIDSALNVFLGVYPNNIAYTPSPPMNNGVPCIAVITQKITNSIVTMEMCINGNSVTLLKQQDCSPTTMFNCESLVIGNNSEFTNRTLNGGIASLIIYNSVLSITDRQRIEGYLAWKWWGTGNAILQTSHPYYDVPIGDIGQLFNPITVS